MEKDVEVERNCYPMYKPFCNLCTFLTPLMILEELVATGAVNDFLRMIVYPPLYNLSLLKSSIPSSPFSLFFHSLIYVPTNHFLISLPSFQPKKPKQNKTKHNNPKPPHPLLLIPKNQLRILPTTPHLHSHITFHLPRIPHTRRSQITTSDILSRTKEFLTRGTRICENSVGGGRTLKIPCIVGATSVDPAGVGAGGVCGVGVCER